MGELQYWLEGHSRIVLIVGFAVVALGVALKGSERPLKLLAGMPAK